MQARVAIIIVNYNGQKYLADCLESLSKTKYDSSLLDTILIDNNSTDDSLEFVRENYPIVKVMPQDDNFGFAGGNNIGMRWAIKHNYDYVFLLNQDTIVTEDWLTPLVELAEADSTIGAVQSKLRLWPDKTKLNTVGNRIHFLGFGYGLANGEEDQGQYDEIQEINYPSGAGVLLRVSLLDQIGLFDDKMFMYLEDLDLGWRIWLSGHRCVYQPASMIYHKYEFDRSMKQVYYFERNRLLCLFRNYRLLTLILIFPAWFLMELGQLVFAWQNKYLGQKLSSYFYFSYPENWLRIKEARKLINQNREVSDRQMLKRFTGKILFQEIKNPLLIYIANPIFNFYLKVIRLIVIW
jgi:GT2 family glycosyltransferase